MIAELGIIGVGVRTAAHDGGRSVCSSHDGPCNDPPGSHLGSRTHMRSVQWQVTLAMPGESLLKHFLDAKFHIWLDFVHV